MAIRQPVRKRKKLKDRGKVTWMSAPLKTSTRSWHSGKPPLPPNRRPISVDESRSLFEVALWHYPCILHQVIERPESMVGCLREWEVRVWVESSLQVLDLKKTNKKKTRRQLSEANAQNICLCRMFFQRTQNECSFSVSYKTEWQETNKLCKNVELYSDRLELNDQNVQYLAVTAVK